MVAKVVVDVVYGNREDYAGKQLSQISVRVPHKGRQGLPDLNVVASLAIAGTEQGHRA